VGTQQGPALVAPEELQPPQSSSLAGAQNCPLRLNRHASCLQLASTRPTARPFLPPLRTPIVPPLLVLPQIDHFPSHRSPRAAAFLQLQPQAPLLPPVDIASPLEGWVTPPGRWLRFGRGLGSTRAKRRRGRRPSNAGRRGTRPSGFVYGGPGSTRATSHSGGKPPQSMRCRDSASRLRTRATFGLRSLAGAVEERHRARRPTVPALSSTPVPGPTLLVAQPTTSTLRGPAPTPARGWV